MKSIFIMGPPGSGKTHFARQFGDFFKRRVVDNWDKSSPFDQDDTLYLTQEVPEGLNIDYVVIEIDAALSCIGATRKSDLPSVPLTISRLQEVSTHRTERWQKGHINNWSLSDWMVALAGEVGEAANIVKKLNRARDGMAGNTKSEKELKMDLANELADIQCYLVLVAERMGVDLETSTVMKFNAVSVKNKFPERL